MYRKLIINNFKKNKLNNLSSILFISVSGLLLFLVCLLTMNLLSSIDNLMLKAKTPDFMQMHQGDIDYDKLEKFAKENPLVKDYQTLLFLNIDGDKIIINGKSQEDRVEDNGLVYQSEKFDYLLNLNNEIIKVNKGEIYLPIKFMKNNDAKVGDKVSVAGMEFIVTGFFRDSQMNSDLAGSKRLLVHKDDYEKIENKGNKEYLIEFLLKDPGKISDFERSYIESNLMNNGPTITYSMFKMINAIADGMLILLLIITSILILIISLLCIRFSLLSMIEDEYREIGVMKAIGMRLNEIKKLYIAQYFFTTLFSIILSFIMGQFIKNNILENIYLYMGKGDNDFIGELIAIFSLLILFVVIIIFVNTTLNKIKKVSTIDAIRNAEKVNQPTAFLFNIKRYIKFGVPFSLALSNVSIKLKQYISVLIIITLTTFLIALPQIMHQTLEDRSFMKYFGIGDIDMTIDIQGQSGILEKEKNIELSLNNDKNIESFERFDMVELAVIVNNTKKAYIKTNFGDHSKFPIEYGKGRSPQNDEEIALTQIYMDDLNLNIGDEIKDAHNDKEYKIVGVFTDISNGGKTAKINGNPTNDLIEKTSIQIKLKDSNDINEIKKKYQDEFKWTKVSSIDEYRSQSFGGLFSELKKSEILILISSLTVLSLIQALFVKLLITKERTQIAILKTLGFTNNKIKLSFLYRFIVLMFISIPLGLFLAYILSSPITSIMLSNFGITSIDMKIDILKTFIFTPLIIAILVILMTFMATNNIANIKISENIKE